MTRVAAIAISLACLVPGFARADLPGPADLAGRTGDSWTLAMSLDYFEDHIHFLVDAFQWPLPEIPMGLDHTIHVTVFLVDDGMREVHFGDDHEGSMFWADSPLFDGSLVRFGLPGGFDQRAIVDVCLGVVEYTPRPGASCPGAAGFYNRYKGGPLYLDLDAVPEIIVLA